MNNSSLHTTIISFFCFCSFGHIHIEDEFILIGSDGLFDVLSNQQAVNVVRNALVEYHGNINKTVKRLVDTALKLESSDNISAVLVQLNIKEILFLTTYICG